MPTALHLAEHALALHFPFQRLERLIDIVVADENLHVELLFDQAVDRPDSQAIWAMAYANGTRARITVDRRNPCQQAPVLPRETSARRRGPSGTQVLALIHA
jgi:hypothetical protein